MIDVAVISLHTSPLSQPGSGDSGGMNVYVRETVSALAHLGLRCVTYTRSDRPGLPAAVDVEPNHRVVHIDAGPHDLAKEALPGIVGEFTDQVLADIAANGGARVVHANYWLSGIVAHRIKHEIDVPFVSTFHTLARVKAEGGDPESAWRDLVESELINCCDAICVSCDSERDDFVRHYGRPTGRIEIVSPGVESALFAPGSQTGARQAIDLPLDRRVVLFVGRIQPLKGPDVAVQALAALDDHDAMLVLVGGSSGVDGDREMERTRKLVSELGLVGRVRFVEPQPHHRLSTYYRAADVVVVPSRSESFGLVALEASACGTPVVASAVGGLLSLVDHGETGFLVPSRTSAAFAAAIDRIFADPTLATSMARNGVDLASRYTWRAAAQRLNSVYTELARERQLVDCH